MAKVKNNFKIILCFSKLLFACLDGVSLWFKNAKQILIRLLLWFSFSRYRPYCRSLVQVLKCSSCLWTFQTTPHWVCAFTVSMPVFTWLKYAPILFFYLKIRSKEQRQKKVPNSFIHNLILLGKPASWTLDVRRSEIIWFISIFYAYNRFFSGIDSNNVLILILLIYSHKINGKGNNKNEKKWLSSGDGGVRIAVKAYWNKIKSAEGDW